MPEVNLENKDRLKPAKPELLSTPNLSEAQEEHGATLLAFEQTEVAFDKVSPKVGKSFRGGVENLSGVSIQGSVLNVAIGDGKFKLDTAQKSFQAEMDTILGDLEAGTKLVSGEMEMYAGANLDLGPVGLRARATQDEEGNRDYTAKAQLPEGFQLWVDQNKEGIEAGARYEWKNDAIGKGSFTVKRDKMGRVNLGGTLNTKDGTEIQVTAVGEVAQIKVSSGLSLGGGRLSTSAAFEAQNLGQGLSRVRLGDVSADVAYTIKF